MQSSRRAWCLQTVRPNVQKMLQAVGATVEGEEALTELTRTPQPVGAITGTGVLPKAEEGGPVTRTAEEGGPTGATTGASNTRWWRGRGGERRCYDEGQQEGQ